LANPGIDHKQAERHSDVKRAALDETEKKKRQERLAAALRENVRRRRTQARRRAGEKGVSTAAEQVSAGKPPQSPSTPE